MDDFLVMIAAQRGGFAFRCDFLDHGLTDRHIREAMKAGLLVRLRHGTYAPQSVLNPLSPELRHRLLAKSIMARLGDGYALSHMSSTLLREPASFGIDLGLVHVTRLDDRQSRQEAGVAFHSGALHDGDLEDVDGVLTTSAARSTFESMTISTTESGLVIANAMLHAGHMSVDELAEYAGRRPRWPGSRHARLGLRLVEPLCESVGESRSMYLFWRERIPRPHVQAVICVGDDSPDPRVDFDWWQDHHVGEFDGLFKYGQLNDGVDRSQVLVREKLREDRIRSTNRGVSRWVYKDLDPVHRVRTADRIRRSIEASRRQFTRNATTILLGLD